MVKDLRREFDDKHRENREELQRLRDTHDGLRSEFHEFKGRVDPYLDNGQPGLFSKMSDKLDGILETLTMMQVQAAQSDSETRGRRDGIAWVAPALASLGVGLVLVLAQHFWK